jgi:hypothetical protein
LLKHRGPAIVLLNKTDVLHAAAEHRAHFGPVDVFPPLTPGDVLTRLKTQLLPDAAGMALGLRQDALRADRELLGLHDGVYAWCHAARAAARPKLAGSSGTATGHSVVSAIMPIDWPTLHPAASNLGSIRFFLVSLSLSVVKSRSYGL